MWEGELTLSHCNVIIAKLRSMLWMSTANNNRSAGTRRLTTCPDMSVQMNLGDMHLCDGYVDNLKAKLDKLQQTVNQQEALYKAIYMLRSLVVKYNCITGVNECLSEINRLNDLIGMYQSINDHCLYEDGTVDRDYLDSIKVPGQTGLLDGLVSSTRKVKLFSKTFIDDKIQEFKTQITGFEQTRDRLNNYTFVVQLPDDIAKHLALPM